MEQEYEIVKHLQLEDLNIFLVNMTYRRLHVHKEFEICMVLAGSLKVYERQGYISLGRGDIVLFNPRQAHELHSLTENTVLLSIQISGNFCRKIYPDIRLLEFEENILTLDKYEREQKARLCGSILNLAKFYFLNEPGYNFFCMSSLFELWGILINYYPWHIITEKEKAERYNKSNRLEHIMAYIDAHFTEKILLTDIAEEEHLSLNYLSHFFKDMIGMSFQQYVALLRFDRARRLVEHTSMSITTICMECGFSDYRYLNNIYKKQLGYTPIEYRNSHAVTDGYIEKKATDLENMQEFYSREESLKLLKIAETQGIFI